MAIITKVAYQAILREVYNVYYTEENDPIYIYTIHRHKRAVFDFHLVVLFFKQKFKNHCANIVEDIFLLLLKNEKMFLTKKNKFH